MIALSFKALRDYALKRRDKNCKNQVATQQHIYQLGVRVFRALAGYSSMHEHIERRNFCYCIRIDFKEAFVSQASENWLLSHLTALILVNQSKVEKDQRIPINFLQDFRK